MPETPSSSPTWKLVAVGEAIVIAILAGVLLERPADSEAQQPPPPPAPEHTLQQQAPQQLHQPSQLPQPPQLPQLPTPPNQMMPSQPRPPPAAPPTRGSGWPEACGKTYEEQTDDAKAECAAALGRLLPAVSEEGGYQCACCKELPGGVTTKSLGEAGTWHNHCVNKQVIERWRCTPAMAVTKETASCPNSCDNGLCL